MIGFLAAAVFLLPSSGDEVEGLVGAAVRIASRWATVWSVASVFYFFIKVGDIFAAPLTGLKWAYISGYAQASEGRAILLQALLAALRGRRRPVDARHPCPGRTARLRAGRRWRRSP